MAELFLAQRVKDDDFVDAVDELGAEVSAQHVHHLGLGLLVFFAGGATGLQPTLDDVRAQVRGGDDDGIGEIHHRSEEHTSELQSRENLVCRLLLEKKN